MADVQVARHRTGGNRAVLLSIPPKPLSCDAHRELRNTPVPRPPPTALKEGVCSFLLEAGGHPGGLLGLPEPGLRLRGLPPAGPRRGRHVPGQSRCPCPLLGDAAAPRPGRSMAEPPPAAFYGAVAPGNPVVDSLEAELRDVLGFLRRLRGAGEAEPQRHDLHRRG